MYIYICWFPAKEISFFVCAWSIMVGGALKECRVGLRRLHDVPGDIMSYHQSY